MFKVPVDKIIPVTNARAQISELVKNINKTKSLYVLTRGGKPAAVLASIDYINNRIRNLPTKKENEFNEIVKTNISPVTPPTQTHPIQHIKIVDKNDGQQTKQIPAHEKEQPIKISLEPV